MTTNNLAPPGESEGRPPPGKPAATTTPLQPPTTTTKPAYAHCKADAVRGKALVESGEHAPPPPQWTDDEVRGWFGPAQPGDVISLDAYRHRREVVA